MDSILLPVQASTLAPEYDKLFYAITYLIAFFFVLIIGAGIYFVVKYRYRGGKHEVVQITHNTALEVAWTVGPLFIVIGIFAWGFKNYMDMVVAPKDSIEIRVTGQKWSWNFEYENGATSAGSEGFAVPKDRPVKLIMSSRDVLHSFFIPSFRVKMDVIPNRYSTLWFQATKTGPFQVYCTEYCGQDHSAMLSKVYVMEENEYAAWLESHKQLGKTPEERGSKLFAGKGGCGACHAVKDASQQPSPTIGPRMWQMYGRNEQLDDGTSVKVDENYIRESIEVPTAKTVAGFQKGAMPTFKGILTDAEIGDIIAYLKSLK